MMCLSKDRVESSVTPSSLTASVNCTWAPVTHMPCDLLTWDSRWLVSKARTSVTFSLGRIQEQWSLDEPSWHVSGTAFYMHIRQSTKVSWVPWKIWLHVVCILMLLNVVLRDDIIARTLNPLFPIDWFMNFSWTFECCVLTHSIISIITLS